MVPMDTGLWCEVTNHPFDEAIAVLYGAIKETLTLELQALCMTSTQARVAARVNSRLDMKPYKGMELNE